MSELRSGAFWVGQIIMLVATVLGIYLAASLGFKQALKLNLVEADRTTYYIAESLYRELEANDKTMKRYIESVQGKDLIFKEHIAGIQLNEFIFRTAQRTASTLEIEPVLLSEISNYYFSVGNALQKYYDSDRESPANLMKLVRAESEKLTALNTLERFSQYNTDLASNLTERGVPIERVEAM